MIKHLFFLSVNDFKLAFRDSSLRFFFLFPWLIILLIAFLFPYISDNFPQYNKYMKYILMGSSIQTSIILAFVYGVFFIDEKDLNINKVYAVTPVNKLSFVISRILIGVLISFFITSILLATQSLHDFLWYENLLISLNSGLLVPIFSFSVAALSKNKMEGMVWFKAFNLLFALPLISFFILDYGYLFGVLPNYWVYQAMDKSISNISSLNFLIIATIISLSLTILTAVIFEKKHYKLN